MKTPLKQFKDPTDSENSSSDTDSDDSSLSKGPRAEPPSKTPEMICEVREYKGHFNLKGEKVVTVNDPKEQVEDKDDEEGNRYCYRI